MKKNILSDLSNVKGITNADNTLPGIKSTDTILRSNILENYYNYQTVKGDLATVKDAFGSSSPNNNISNNINNKDSNIAISSVYPNKITIFNNGKPQLIK